MTFQRGPLWQNNGNEAEAVGRILLGYTELEIDFWRVLAVVLDDDQQATRLMFYPESNELHLASADAIIRKAMGDRGLSERYSNIYGELSSCRKIRNDYAHAYWNRKDDGCLQFVNLRSAARHYDGAVDDEKHMTDVTPSKLREQEQIFIRVHAQLEKLISDYVAAQ